jgi:phospholipid transport system substrate-binding protein
MLQHATSAALAAALTLVVPMLAAAQSGSATAYVERRNAEVDGLMGRPVPTDAARAARDARVGAIIDQFLDYPALARGTLGTEWDARTPAEQQEFLVLLTQGIQQSYLRSLESIRDYRVEYLGEDPIGGGVVVHARARSRASGRAEPILIDYAMHLVDGEWRVFDITTDQASLVRGQGQGFRRIIAAHGWAEFLVRMREHLAHPAG